MVVDDKVYCGSMNIANWYSSKKYGSWAFRDLCVVASNSEVKYYVKDFFLDQFRDNQKYYKNMDLKKIE